jgi:hypothetical protein
MDRGSGPPDSLVACRRLSVGFGRQHSWTLCSWKSWTSLLWCSLTTSLCTRRVQKNMKSISKSCFNKCETISCMWSLACVSSGSMRYNSWVMWYHLKELWWSLARWDMSWIRSHHYLCTKCEVSLGWLAIIEGSFWTSLRLQSLSPSYWRRVTSISGVKIVMKPFWLWRSC